MLEFKMPLPPPDGLEGALRLLNELKWNISIVKRGDTWLVFGGDVCLLKSSSEEAAHAFIYGLALAYSVLPSTIFDQIRESARKAAGE